MSPTLSYKSYRIDEHSQRMLLRLLEADGAVGTGDLTQPSGFEEGAYNKVKYRIDTHLKPAGFVTELVGRDESGRDGPRHFEITRVGERWVAEHQDQIGEVHSIAAAASEAAEALEAAESARDSVQSYRKKVSRLKGRVEDVEDDIGDLEGRMEDAKEERQSIKMIAKYARGKATSGERLEAVAERVAATEEQIAETDEELAELQSRVSALEEGMEKLRAEQNRMVEDINESFGKIEKHLDRLNEEDSGVLDRLSPFR